MSTVLNLLHLKWWDICQSLLPFWYVLKCSWWTHSPTRKYFIGNVINIKFTCRAYLLNSVRLKRLLCALFGKINELRQKYHLTWNCLFQTFIIYSDRLKKKSLDLTSLYFMHIYICYYIFHTCFTVLLGVCTSPLSIHPHLWEPSTTEAVHFSQENYHCVAYVYHILGDDVSSGLTACTLIPYFLMLLLIHNSRLIMNLIIYKVDHAGQYFSEALGHLIC